MPKFGCLAGSPDVDAATDLPLVVLPDSCALNRFVLRRLNEMGTRYRTAHTASGVGGLQAAVTAGLGITCLNASAVPPGLTRLGGGGRLPTVPDVEFAFVPQQRREPRLIDECRRMLLRHFA